MQILIEKKLKLLSIKKIDEVVTFFTKFKNLSLEIKSPIKYFDKERVRTLAN